MIEISFILFLLLYLFLFIANVGTHGIRMMLMDMGVRERQPIDISAKQIPAPKSLESNVASLTKLGFARLGEIQTTILLKPYPEWIFISPDMTVHAELVEIAPTIIIFSTVYTDDAAIETGYPFGENINTKNFQSRTCTVSVEEAYRRHLQLAEDFSKSHGAPCKFKDMEDYLYWDRVYRLRHAALKFNRLAWINLIYSCSFIYSLAVTVVAAASAVLVENLTVERVKVILLFLLAAQIPAAVADLLAISIAKRGSRRDSKYR